VLQSESAELARELALTIRRKSERFEPPLLHHRQQATLTAIDMKSSRIHQRELH
jgi:hypothetical protein